MTYETKQLEDHILKSNTARREYLLLKPISYWKEHSLEYQTQENIISQYETKVINMRRDEYVPVTYNHGVIYEDYTQGLEGAY